jgi:hypothetical protein
VRVTQVGQLDQPDPVRERPPHVGGDPQREPRLADAAGAGQRQQPGRGQQALGLRQLTPPADKAGQL